ncbi:unnamed protein product [Bursaphelenchus okinawaensis]|uniref:Uncharacterized protein n=1 Tax=Bursaphelenchus okinawaensis TaxID=465554 RepID=A0A811JWZ2_9BILA|nr:unnamed protein product [Bursaphelenchus okinawaensis]CAG9086706.1 unnamed protein product [Bursaphelenchus okinawaensis]
MDASIPERCLYGRLHIRTGIKLIIAVGVAVLLALTALLAVYFRKAIFVLSISYIVTILTAGAVFRRDHRFMYPLLGVSYFHIFLASHFLLIFAFYFFFKPLYILMVFNWAFDTLDTGKNPGYYLKCFVLVLIVSLFLIYNIWQAAMAKHFLDHLQQNDLRLDSGIKVSGSSSSSVALNYSHSESPKTEKRNAIVFVGGPELQTGERTM